MSLTKEDLATLTAWFPVERHEFLNGMAYITEDAIAERLDEIDPAWQFLVTNIIQRGTTIVVTARMEVKGVVREGVGMEKIRAKADGVDTNEAEKSAVTDTLKRCARLFGIGRYLLTLASDVKDHATLAAWFKRQRGGTQPGNITQMPQSNGNGHQNNGQQQSQRPATIDLSKPPLWWDSVRTAIVNWRHFDGVMKHATAAMNKLMREGELNHGQTQQEVLAILETKYPQDIPF